MFLRRMVTPIGGILLMALLFALPATAQQRPAGGRFALVIGNGTYPDAPLRNPPNDAQAMAATLRQMGFDVLLRENVAQKDMQRAIGEFGHKLTPGSTALFFFSGHGMQVRGQNFIIPTDAQLRSEADVRLEAINVDTVLDQMMVARSAVNLVILDACRNNPYERRFRSMSAGLASIDAPEGTLIAYATAPGKVASDGDGANGLYTSELLKALKKPGAKVEDVFKQTRVAVSRLSNGEQLPWESSSLTGDFYFQPSGNAASTASAPPPPPPTVVAQAQGQAAERSLAAEASAYELAFWDAIKSSTNPLDYQAYLEAFPAGKFVPLARVRAAMPKPSAPVQPDASGVDVEEMEAEYQVVASANVRELPSAEAARVGKLRPGKKVLVTGKVRDANWYRVQPEDGPSGFVFGETLRQSVVPREGSGAPTVVPAPPEQTASARPPAVPAPEVPTAEAAVAIPSPRSLPKPGETFRDCPDCPELVAIPAGEFEMGTRDDPTEKPVHRVAIGKPFALGRFEVTFAEWDACVEAAGCKHRPDDRGWGRGDRPVMNVSWNDAKAYLGWLSAKTGRAYRLPSEAEWEFAARAGTRTAYWWGNGIGKANANCAGCGSEFDRRRTAPVASFAASPLGLYNMLGNVAEWVEDCWNPSYRGAPADGSAWTRDGCVERVLRGGSFNNDPRYLRATARFKYDADVRFSANGFRVARALP